MDKKKVAIIGGGISGLTVANRLKERFEVKIYEKASRPGGLIKCKRVDENLYHIVGGHVFNSKRQDVLEYFWSFFDRKKEFIKAVRNACIFLDKPVGYPIENHIYELANDQIKAVLKDLLSINREGQKASVNFEQFLKNLFGTTLYSIYFEPYNKKIWNRDLSGVPISWLEGKLPMPTVDEILYHNLSKQEEANMVHSSFYYPVQNGSQFLIDRLAEGIEITCDAEINSISKTSESNKWQINNENQYDVVVYAGNIKDLIPICDDSLGVDQYRKDIESLEYHGTTTVLCEIEENPFSWIYVPDSKIAAHRIINTGNFADSNNKAGIRTATIEFTDFVDKKTVLDNLKKLPFSPKYIDHTFTEFTYPIQQDNTRCIISTLKEKIEPQAMFLVGRFAEWEYYNMDAAMGAAMDLSDKIMNITNQINQA